MSRIFMRRSGLAADAADGQVGSLWSRPPWTGPDGYPSPEWIAEYDRRHGITADALELLGDLLADEHTAARPVRVEYRNIVEFLNTREGES